MRNYDTVIFDLDGTLLDTLEDLTDSVNYAMLKSGFPERSLEEVRNFVGNGIVRLMELAVPDGKGNPLFKDTFDTFKQHYSQNSRNKTKLYPGIMELLRELHEAGYKLAIVSNKYHDAVSDLNNLYFKQYISVKIGEKENIRKKPAPDTVLQALRELGSVKERALYVGDSEVDIETARNVGMDCVMVSWGFRGRDKLKECGAERIVDRPEDILKLL